MKDKTQATGKGTSTTKPLQLPIFTAILIADRVMYFRTATKEEKEKAIKSKRPFVFIKMSGDKLESEISKEYFMQHYERTAITECSALRMAACTGYSTDNISKSEGHAISAPLFNKMKKKVGRVSVSNAYKILHSIVVNAKLKSVERVYNINERKANQIIEQYKIAA